MIWIVIGDKTAVQYMLRAMHIITFIVFQVIVQL